MCDRQRRGGKGQKLMTTGLGLESGKLPSQYVAWHHYFSWIWEMWCMGQRKEIRDIFSSTSMSWSGILLNSQRCDDMPPPFWARQINWKLWILTIPICFSSREKVMVEAWKKSSQLSVPKSLLKWGRGAFQGCLWKWGAKLNRLLMSGLGNPSSWDCFTNLGLQAKLIFSYWNPLPNWIAQNAW